MHEYIPRDFTLFPLFYMIIYIIRLKTFRWYPVSFRSNIFFYLILSPGNQNYFIRMIDHPICTMILAFPKTENSYHNLFLICLGFFSFYGRKEICFKVKIIKFQVKINVSSFNIFFKGKRFFFEESLKLNALMTRLTNNWIKSEISE